MGMWIELGIFVLVLAFGMWQIHDVGLEHRKRQAHKEAAKSLPDKASEEGSNLS
jgi:ABC-type nickel/cobalt efflux system permease component RcnA